MQLAGKVLGSFLITVLGYISFRVAWVYLGAVLRDKSEGPGDWVVFLPMGIAGVVGVGLAALSLVAIWRGHIGWAFGFFVGGAIACIPGVALFVAIAQA